MKLHLDLENLFGTAGGRAVNGVKITGAATIEDDGKVLGTGRINITGKIESAGATPYRATIELKANPNPPALSVPPWKANGFESEQEMIDLIMRVDPLKPELRMPFHHWCGTDGTKAGLLKLLDETKPA